MRASGYQIGILWVVMLLTIHHFASAQSSQPQQCATVVADSISRIRFPQRGSLSDFEFEIQAKIQELEADRRAGRTQSTILSIPVVFHIVHNGEPVGTGTNLSFAQVQSQVTVLNEDFRRLPNTPGYNTSPVGADIEIEFCLSPVDENGVTLPEAGIHRYLGNKSSWSRNDIENILKPTTIWNPNLFFNVWSVKFAATESTLLGYAQFPDQSGLSGLPASGPGSTDGVVVRYQSIGSSDKGTFPVQEAPYNKGRTLTHETGHWLGLRHIWGDGNCADDFVADTPPASGPSSGCPLGRVSCGGTNMIENYMDYSNDACMNIFTQGQKVRMLATMAVSPRRKTLVIANLCSPQVADVPTANFTVDRQKVLKGGQASFTDLSSNFPTEWSWSFEGGEPATSTLRNPQIKYSVPGVYQVSLTARNSLGASAPFVATNYITVSQEGLCGEYSNYEPGYTASTLNIGDFAPFTGYLTGHNTSHTKAVSEYFANTAGYSYISGVNIRFGALTYENEDAQVKVTVWNARGPQNAPGSVIETKSVLLRAIQEDIDNNRATSIVFDRETPVFSKPFQVGVELVYGEDISLAVRSSANGEALNATSWVQNEAGAWSTLAIAYGANIAMDIQPLVGMKPSVQVSSSKLLAFPGEEVTLNGRGASIFVWETSDGVIRDFSGPQLKVKPEETIAVTTVGSGLDLCIDQAVTTIYIRENIVGVNEQFDATTVDLFPNPGGSELNVNLRGKYIGSVQIEVTSAIGQSVLSEINIQKSSQELEYVIPAMQWPGGLYLVQVRMGDQLLVRKWIKR